MELLEDGEKEPRALGTRKWGKGQKGKPTPYFQDRWASWRDPKVFIAGPLDTSKVVLLKVVFESG